jgi:hypothetical protein
MAKMPHLRSVGERKAKKKIGVLDGRVRYFIEPRTETDTDEED